MDDPALPWRYFWLWVAFIGGVGVVFGGIRGSNYWPTFPVALVEDGLLFAVPAGLVGLLALGIVAASRRVRHCD